MDNKFQDRVFGELIWEEAYKWWQGKVEIQPRLMIETYLCGPRTLVVEDIALFHKVFENFRQNETKARLCAAERLLEVHNTSWIEDGEAEITQEEFCRRIQPQNITCYPDQTAEIFYHDDDLFWGHAILVSMDEKGNFTDADIAG